MEKHINEIISGDRLARDVFISEVPLSKHLTKEQVERLIPLKD